MIKANAVTGNIFPNSCGQYLQGLFDAMCEGFALHEIICNDEGRPVDYRFLEVNTIFEQMTGLKREAIIGRTVRELMPDTEAYWIKTYGRVALTGEQLQFENYSGVLDKYFRVSAFSPERGQFVTLFIDITELKEAEQALKKHQILFENAHDIVLYVGVDGKILDANRNAEEKYGYPRSQLLHMSISDIRHSSMMDSFEEQMRSADTTGVVFEGIHVTKDGTSFPVEVSAKSTLIGDERIRIHIVRDITERKKAEEKITYLATIDSLTGIANRSHLMQQLKLAMEQADRGNYKLAVMLFDIDKFKTINDLYGHAAGDMALKETALRVSTALRQVDTVGRLGGDEFLILQPFIKGSEDAIALVQRILDRFGEPFVFEDNRIDIRLSIGISLYPDDTENGKDLIQCADKGMYHVKQKGGGGYELFSRIR